MQMANILQAFFLICGIKVGVPLQREVAKEAREAFLRMVLTFMCLFSIAEQGYRWSWFQSEIMCGICFYDGFWL